jgi:hypothetical protein
VCSLDGVKPILCGTKQPSELFAVVFVTDFAVTVIELSQLGYFALRLTALFPTVSVSAQIVRFNRVDESKRDYKN